MFFVYLAGWLILGFIGGFIFAQKGYPPQLGFAIGALFGPIALAICVVLPSTQEARDKAALEVEIGLRNAKNAGTKICPQCNRELGRGASVCPRCEHRFEPSSFQ